MTFANISAVGWPLWAPRPPHGPLGSALMNDLGRLVQQRPSVRPEALEGGRSLINIDLAPREAACWRAGPGHPRRGLIKSGSTAQPGRQGRLAQECSRARGPHKPGGSLLPGQWVREGLLNLQQFKVQAESHEPVPSTRHPPAPGSSQRGTQPCPRSASSLSHGGQ